jgi:hypothetical protein
MSNDLFHTYHFTFEEVCPEVEELMLFLQLPDADSYLPVKDIVDMIFATLEDTKGITGGYTIKDCLSTNAKEGLVICSAGTLHTGRRISRYMESATEIALFICTAGAIFTELSQAYQQSGDLLEAFVVESIGSATVEKAMTKIQSQLEQEMEREGKKITNRYSPGYCDWALSEQQALFSYIGNHSTGITVNSSSLMQPIKSVSGIIGIGVDVKKKPYGCSICKSSTCVYRRIINN